MSLIPLMNYIIYFKDVMTILNVFSPVKFVSYFGDFAIMNVSR